MSPTTFAGEISEDKPNGERNEEDYDEFEAEEINYKVWPRWKEVKEEI